MKKVEVLYFEGCPNHRETAELAREIVRELGVAAEVNEVRVTDSDDAERLRFLGSPSVRVDGFDIEPAARSSSAYGLACRTYGRTGVPPRELLAAALGSGRRDEVVAGGRKGASWCTMLAVPGVGALLLPVGTCPACWPAYAGFLSSFGLGFLLHERYLLPVAGTLLVVALASLAFRARSRRGYRPFILGLAGSLLALLGKFTLSATPLLYLGLLGLVAAGAWNAWPVRDASPVSCEKCAPRESRAETI